MAKTTTRLKKIYEDVIVPALMKQFNYSNVMQVPRLHKIVINMGVGEAVNDNKKIQQAADELTLIAGQKCVITHARKAIATFKIRKGLAIGCKVTLRREKNVRVHGSPGEHGAAARARFPWHPRPAASTVTATTPLASRADRVPGNQLRQDRRNSRSRHRFRHHGENRRRGARAASRASRCPSSKKK